MPKSRRTLEDRAVELVRRYPSTEGPDRTLLVREIAHAMVDLRQHFTTKDGEVDWTGRTGAYRDAVRDVYARANVDADTRAQLQAAVRWQVGNVIRDTLTPEELGELGLLPNAPRQRGAAQRVEKAALLRAVTSGDYFGTDPSPAIEAARGLLGAVNVDSLAELDARAAADARRALQAIRRRVAKLLAGLPPE